MRESRSSLLIREYASRIFINDLSLSIYCFWKSVLNDTDAICRLIRDTPITYAEWQRQRAVQDAKARASDLELGFSTFFLNRTNRSCIIDTGGVIGGAAQRGTWKIDARFNRSKLIERIQRIARYRSRIELHNTDAVEFVSQVLPLLPARSLIYFDPPYYGRGERLYDNHYTHLDHCAVAQFVQRLNVPWLVSYDDSEDITRMYHASYRLVYNLQYSAADRGLGAELMFASADLQLPASTRPQCT